MKRMAIINAALVAKAFRTIQSVPQRSLLASKLIQTTTLLMSVRSKKRILKRMEKMVTKVMKMMQIMTKKIRVQVTRNTEEGGEGRLTATLRQLKLRKWKKLRRQSRLRQLPPMISTLTLTRKAQKRQLSAILSQTLRMSPRLMIKEKLLSLQGTIKTANKCKLCEADGYQIKIRVKDCLKSLITILYSSKMQFNL